MKPNSVNRFQMLSFTSRATSIQLFEKIAIKIVAEKLRVKEGLIAKRILEYQYVNIETVCIEITISKRKWCLTFACRPPYNNKATFFMELNKSLCNIARKYENILIIGDLNINFDNLQMGDTHSHMSDLCDTFSLSNLVNGVTCVKSQMLTNRPKSFYNTSSIETGLSDCHKMIVSVFRAFLGDFRLKS